MYSHTRVLILHFCPQNDTVIHIRSQCCEKLASHHIHAENGRMTPLLSQRLTATPLHTEPSNDALPFSLPVDPLGQALREQTYSERSEDNNACDNYAAFQSVHGQEVIHSMNQPPPVFHPSVCTCPSIYMNVCHVMSSAHSLTTATLTDIMLSLERCLSLQWEGQAGNSFKDECHSLTAHNLRISEATHAAAVY